ncbi:MAG: HNH endonuclease [Armatimonadetes bacterium]|nr:HNH endonuclease [Armatimonadota bacterium]
MEPVSRWRPFDINNPARTMRHEGKAYRSRKKKWLVFLRDNHTCQICGTPVVGTQIMRSNEGRNHLVYHCANGSFLTLDHIIPKCVSKCGKRENLQAACNECNKIKNDSLPNMASSARIAQALG